MTVCSGPFTCDGTVELIAVTLVSFGTVLYSTIRYDRSVPRALLYGFLSLFAYPLSFAALVLFYYTIGVGSIAASSALVMLASGSAGYFAYASLHRSSTRRSMRRFAVAFCFGVAAGWIAAALGTPVYFWLG